MAATEIAKRGAWRPAEAARWIGSSRDTLDRLIADGALVSFKIGAARYISARELERFIAEREAAAAGERN